MATFIRKHLTYDVFIVNPRTFITSFGYEKYGSIHKLKQNEKVNGYLSKDRLYSKTNDNFDDTFFIFDEVDYFFFDGAFESKY